MDGPDNTDTLQQQKRKTKMTCEQHRWQLKKMSGASGKLRSHRTVIIDLLNVGSDGDEVTSAARVFHTRAAATGKAWSPTMSCFDECRRSYDPRCGDWWWCVLCEHRRLEHANILLLMAMCYTNDMEDLVLLYERVNIGSLYTYLYQTDKVRSQLVCHHHHFYFTVTRKPTSPLSWLP